jgi:hypothetical protein
MLSYNPQQRYKYVEALFNVIFSQQALKKGLAIDTVGAILAESFVLDTKQLLLREIQDSPVVFHLECFSTDHYLYGIKSISPWVRLDSPIIVAIPSKWFSDFGWLDSEAYLSISTAISLLFDLDDIFSGTT